jgi:hypothetical protein
MDPMTLSGHDISPTDIDFPPDICLAVHPRTGSPTRSATVQRIADAVARTCDHDTVNRILGLRIG